MLVRRAETVNYDLICQKIYENGVADGGESIALFCGKLCFEMLGSTNGFIRFCFARRLK